MLTFIIDALVTVVGVTTPILLAATGELVVEKSGVLNLGIEGMMLIGAVTGFAVTLTYGADLGDWRRGSACSCAALAGAASSMLFAVLVLTLGSNQVATGLALAIFGIGLSSLIGAGYVGMIVPSFDSVFPDWLAGDPFWRVVFGYSPLVYFALIMVFAVGWFLNRTRAGLILRAVGENDISAHSIGYPVIAIRYAAIAFGGALAGIGGSYFSMVITPMWAEQMTAGRGWIALALVVFSGWRAGRLLAGAYFFGVLMTLELYAKASGFSFLPSQFWAAMPYIMAVVVLAVMSARDVAGSEAPACLGRPFLPNSLSADAMSHKEKKMSTITRRNFMKTAAAGLALPALGRSAFAAEPLKVGFVYLGAIGDYGWTWSHEQGPQGAGRRAERPGGHQLCRERQGRRERHSDHEGPRPAGQQAHLHHLLRLHGPDARGRQAVSRRQVGALHRLQARRQCRHLQLPLLSGPSGDRHDRRHDVEDAA